MNTRQYNYLIVIAACESLSVAAQRLGVTQAALSKFLAEQERMLGVKLFVRYHRRMVPTPAGKRYLDAAQQILNVKNQTLQTINRLSHAGAPAIRFASTPYRGPELFSRVFERFAARYPSIDLTLKEVFSSAQEEEVHRDRVDFAFGVNLHAGYDDVLNLPVSREELTLAVPSFHPLARFASRDSLVSMPIQAFSDTPFVLPGPKNNIRIMADQLFQDAGFTPVIAFESVNGMTVDSMIRRGAGVGFIPERYVKQEPELAYFHLSPPCFEISYIRCRRERVLSAAERFLLGILVEERLKTPAQKLLHSPEIDSFLEELNSI